MTSAGDDKRDGAQMDFSQRMGYGDYLQLDQILQAQTPLSDAPDELLFIIQHQTSELWMKLALRELNAARAAIAADQMPQAFKMLSRVSRIMEQLNSAWDVLRTMTPSDYTTFRAALGQSSGFQSLQYRVLEFALGNRDLALLKPHAHDAASTALLTEELTRFSLYEEVLRLAGRSKVLADKDIPEVPGQEARRACDAVKAMWLTVYNDTSAYWTLYELAEKLVDLEDYFRRWRFNHVTTVERVIGFKQGTGGTGGVSYLKRMLDVELFPELWHMRTDL